MALLIDTHVLIWIGEGNPKLSGQIRKRMFDPQEQLLVSAVTAYEYADLHHRRKIPVGSDLHKLCDQLGFLVLDYPADLWPIAASLPNIHGDPVDRMLAAHALALQIPLVTADRHLHQYPIETLW